ncbi:MAG: kelch repeat-containing protein [Planctomycetota bacterium]
MLFGGIDQANQYSNATFQLGWPATGGPAWGPVAAAASPPPRAYHAMAGSSQLGRILLFGGIDANGFLGDLWQYVPFTGTWTQLSPTGNTPQPRALHSMCEGPGGSILLFGGTGPGTLTSTWQLAVSLFGSSWSPIQVPGPSSRTAAGFAWDPDRQVAVMHGGFDVMGQQTDTWELRNDSGSLRWRQVTPTGPTVAAEALLAYDGTPSPARVIAAKAVPAGGASDIETLEFTPSLASYSTFGTMPWACVVGTTPLRMPVQGNALPTLGSVFPMTMHDVAPGAFLVAGVELGQQPIPIPIPTTPCGCEFYQNQPVSFAFANVGPRSPFSLSIANNTMLIGALFTVQGYHIDFTTCGISTTPMLRLTVGT